MELFIELLIAIVFGISIGTITGIIPGIHINLVVTLLIGFSASLLHYITPIVLCIFIIALAITHIFLDFIPSIFLGAPEESTTLSVLPGHRYILAGNGLMAVKLALIGSFFGLFGASILMYPLIKFIALLYPIIKNYMLFFLLFIIGSMIIQNTRKVWAIIVFILAGIAGFLVFNIPNVREPLFPLLTGLFGTATLLISLNEKNIIPQQWDTETIAIERKVIWKALISGQCSAVFVSLFPGVSPAIAAIFGMQLTKNIGDHGYMMLQGCINSAGFLLSIGTVYAIQKARNGAVVGIQQLLGIITLQEVFLFALASLITAALAVPLTLFFARIFCTIINKVNYKKLVIAILCFIVLLTIIISSWIGILILITTTAIGMIPGIVKVTRTQAMGCLLLPTIVYYILT